MQSMSALRKLIVQSLVSRWQRLHVKLHFMAAGTYCPARESMVPNVRWPLILGLYRSECSTAAATRIPRPDLRAANVGTPPVYACRSRFGGSYEHGPRNGHKRHYFVECGREQPRAVPQTEQPNTLVSVGQDLLAFTINEQADGTIVAQHVSHASHSSHSSHSSQFSSR